MSKLKTPVISIVIGEGGSGGALAIGVCDKLFLLEYSTYSVISPEGCASILWKSADKASQAAEAMAITSTKLLANGLIDGVIDEPLGGAHRDLEAMKSNIKKVLLKEVNELCTKSIDDLLSDRYARLMSYGKFTES
jgi:acetyl-CoA carboxylase carboxyl transferase subunit alpha